MELGIDLTFGHFGADGKAVDAVVADDAAPQGVVKVEHQCLFVAAVQRLDDVGHAVGQRRDSVETHRVLVHVPEESVAPRCQAVVGGEVVDVVDVKMLVAGRIGVEFLVQAADEVRPSMHIPDVAVAHQAVVRAVEVILDDGAGEFLFQCLPHRLEMGVLLVQHRVDGFRAVGGGGQGSQVAPVRVDVDDVGVEVVQLRRAEHGVLPILGVFALVKFRLNAVLQQKQPQLVGHFVCGRPAEDGDFFVQRMRVLRQQLAPQLALFAQQGLGIQRIMEAVHGKLL